MGRSTSAERVVIILVHDDDGDLEYFSAMTNDTFSHLCIVPDQ